MQNAMTDKKPSSRLNELRKGSTVEEEEAQLVEEQRKHGIQVQPKTHRHSISDSNKVQPDFMSWSIGSLFLCFCWGLLAFLESNKVRKFNEAHDYHEAARHSRIAYRHNVSAVACFVVCIFILGVPWAIALAVQGSISNYPTVREFFG